MNSFEHFVCSTSLWRRMTHRSLLPWVLSGARLGEHVLEIGAGYGAATGHLLQLAPRVTSLEYDARAIRQLKANQRRRAVAPLCGDAAMLPFADQSFSSVVAILVLHHLKSTELQDRAFAEAHRVLRPGGSLFAFEINDGLIHRIGHYKSTFTPVVPGLRVCAAHQRRLLPRFRGFSQWRLPHPGAQSRGSIRQQRIAGCQLSDCLASGRVRYASESPARSHRAKQSPQCAPSRPRRGSPPASGSHRRPSTVPAAAAAALPARPR